MLRRSFHERYPILVKTSCDFVVIGQGLAGCALAWALREAGVVVHVVDRGEAFTASRIAAGLITPVTGKRLARSWRFEELLPAATAFYQRIEAETQSRFFHPGPMVRLLKDADEEAHFAKRAETELHGLWREPQPPLNPLRFRMEYPAFEMPTAARLDVAAFLDVSRRVWEQEGRFHRLTLDPIRDIVLSPDGVTIPRLELRARRVIFCEGIAARRNPWFREVPFQPTRGDILTVRIPNLDESRIVHRGVWLVPLGNHLFRAGSTYDHECLEPIPSEAGREEILHRLREFVLAPVEVIEHHAAVRPIIHERRPLLGVLPHEPRIGFFNGLGSKGSLLAPFFASQLARFLSGTGTIDPEVDLAHELANSGPSSTAAPTLRFTEQAHLAVREVLQPGEIAIDATAGNGFDTLFLARLVGETGRVFAFDVQPAALARTATRLDAEGQRQVTLVQGDHAEFAEVVPAKLRERIGAVMFNLGYLPGGDKALTSTTGSSLVAIQAALEWLRPGGILTVIAYTGHPGGAEETEAIRELVQALPQAGYTSQEMTVNRGRSSAPVLFLVRKCSEERMT